MVPVNELITNENYNQFEIEELPDLKYKEGYKIETSRIMNIDNIETYFNTVIKKYFHNNIVTIDLFNYEYKENYTIKGVTEKDVVVSKGVIGERIHFFLTSTNNEKIIVNKGFVFSINFAPTSESIQSIKFEDDWIIHDIIIKLLQREGY